MKPPSIMVNGALRDRVSVRDRGLMYGDGLFETLAVAGGVPLLWDAHLQRLAAGCSRLGIPSPDAQQLRREADVLCRGARRAVLKLIVTRGEGNRGYRAPPEAHPTCILVLDSWPAGHVDHRHTGIRAMVCDTPLAIQPHLAGIKHLNRLEQVLARKEWEGEYQEGIMLDTLGSVIEGTMSNVFLVRDGALATPALDRAGVAGIMRAQVLAAAARLGVNTQICPLGLDEVHAADAVFFTNSIVGIWPVARLGERSYRPHPLPRRLMDVLAAVMVPSAPGTPP